MNTDSSLDRYDELLLLARDARQRRRWTTHVTQGLIVGAMGLNFAYLYAVNSGLQSARQDAQEVEDRITTLTRERDEARVERDQFRAEALIYKRQGDALVSIAPTLELGSRLGDMLRVWVERALPVTSPDTRTASTTTEVQRFYDLVWFVDGSRRIPMTAGDVLWIPEASRRIRIKTIDPPKVTDLQPGDIAVTIDVLPDSRDPDATPIASATLPYAIPIRSTVDVGTTNCVMIESLGESTREGFADGRFVDVDIRFVPRDPCEP
jgi:hypothetical protein